MFSEHGAEVPNMEAQKYIQRCAHDPDKHRNQIDKLLVRVPLLDL